jgi:hypothetical protein
VDRVEFVTVPLEVVQRIAAVMRERVLQIPAEVDAEHVEPRTVVSHTGATVATEQVEQTWACHSVGPRSASWRARALSASTSVRGAQRGHWSEIAPDGAGRQAQFASTAARLASATLTVRALK